MGPLADNRYVDLVKVKIAVLKKTMSVAYEGDAVFKSGSFVNPVLFRRDTPFETNEPHEIEAFGHVNTVMPYKNLSEAIEIAKLGQGSLVASLFTADNEIAKQVVLQAGAYHGRIMIINRNSAKGSTGHGFPLPHLTHGGPGRAGGGEEMGGIRGLLKYMQRVALQGDPSTLTYICNEYIKGGDKNSTKFTLLKNILMNFKSAKPTLHIVEL